MKLVNKYTIVLSSIIIFLVFYIFNIYLVNKNNAVDENFAITHPQRAVIAIALAFIVIMLYSHFKFKIIYPIIFVAGTLYIFLFPYFTVIDETYHFAYVDYIAHHFKLPLVYELIPNRVFAVAQHFWPDPSPTDSSALGVSGIIYEAFQPPVYYILAAFVYNLSFGNPVISVYLIKYFGLIMLMVTIYFIKKTHDKAIEKNYIQQNDFLLFSILLLLSITPGIMIRMITISNVNILPVLCAILLYFIFKYSFKETILYKYEVLILSILTAAIVLTQITAVFLVPLVFLFIFWKKDFKNAVWFGLTFCAFMVPWLVFNYIHYDSLTASKIVQDLQRIGVNPNNDTYGLWYIAMNIPRMFTSFWYPQEGGMSEQPFFMIIEFLTVLVAIILMSILYTQVKKITKDKSINTFLLFSSLTLLSNILIVFFITIWQSWDVLYGRYIYMSLSAIAPLIFVYISQLQKDNKNIISFLFILFSFLLYINYLGQIIWERSVLPY